MVHNSLSLPKSILRSLEVQQKGVAALVSPFSCVLRLRNILFSSPEKTRKRHYAITATTGIYALLANPSGAIFSPSSLGVTRRNPPVYSLSITHRQGTAATSPAAGSPAAGSPEKLKNGGFPRGGFPRRLPPRRVPPAVAKTAGSRAAGPPGDFPRGGFPRPKPTPNANQPN